MDLTVVRQDLTLRAQEQAGIVRARLSSLFQERAGQEVHLMTAGQFLQPLRSGTGDRFYLSWLLSPGATPGEDLGQDDERSSTFCSQAYKRLGLGQVFFFR